MKVLIIGDALSQYTINFSAALKRLDDSVDLNIINTRPAVPNEVNPTLRATYSDVFHYRPMEGLLDKIPRVRAYLRKYRGQKTIERVKQSNVKYDVILLHGFWKHNCEIYYEINVSRTFTVGAVWGSDFYQRSANGPLVFKTMDSCDVVVISTQNMVEDIKKVKDIDNAKIRNCLFGLAPLDLLAQMQKVSSAESKVHLGFEPDDLIITCGYNGSPNQQHLDIISSLSRVIGNKKIKVLVPLTYGGNKAYYSAVRKALITSKLDYKVYDTFLTDETIAHVRKATDVMLQVQRSDAFSGSMLEHLFAQNIVITGSWLPYQSLKEKNIYYETINDLSKLDEKLMYVLNNIELLKGRAEHSNTSDKFLSSLWSECIKDWYAALQEYKSTSGQHG